VWKEISKQLAAVTAMLPDDQHRLLDEILWFTAC
jgi:hypothetical protein